MTSLHFKGVTLPVEDNTDDSLRNFRRYVNSDTSKPMTHHYMLFSRYDHLPANRPTNEPLYKKTCLRGFWSGLTQNRVVQIPKRGHGGLVVNTSEAGYRGRGFEPHTGRHVVSLSKTYLPLNSTVNTKEAEATPQNY